MSVPLLIESGLIALGLPAAPGVVTKASTYLDLLSRWNQVTNLTSAMDAPAMVSAHLMDSFAIAPWITGQNILDVGSGAGLPGIPLALLYPDKDFILLDSNGKKTRFMTQAKIELDLANVEVLQARVEKLEGEYDQVVCRALADLTGIAKMVAHLIGPQGSVLAMKGPGKQLIDSDVLKIVEVFEIDVPLLESKRQLVRLSR